MLVHQCSSCKKISGHTGFVDTVPALPSFWSRITVDMAWGNTADHQKVTYDLCDECSRMPITFGNIELNRNK